MTSVSTKLVLRLVWEEGRETRKDKERAGAPSRRTKVSGQLGE